MLDNIREWISDNLRYILLGLAVIVVVILAVVIIRAATHSGSSGNKATVEVQTEAQTEEESDVSSGVTDALEKDQPEEVLELATSYWNAVIDEDYDELEKLCDKTFDDSDRAEMDSLYSVVESCSDITTYSKPGLTDDSYVVYVYMEWNLVGIETAAPTLREMYMETDDDGNLIVVPSEDYTNAIEEYTQERQTDSDVQALIKDVNNTLNERCEEDEDLKNYVESSSGSISDDEEEEPVEGESEDDNNNVEASLGTMYVYVEGGLNVRDSASADGTLLGSLPEGSEVEVLENQNDGWSRISYIDSNGSTVEGYVMTEYLSE